MCFDRKSIDLDLFIFLSIITAFQCFTVSGVRRRRCCFLPCVLRVIVGHFFLFFSVVSAPPAMYHSFRSLFTYLFPLHNLLCVSRVRISAARIHAYTHSGRICWTCSSPPWRTAPTPDQTASPARALRASAPSPALSGAFTPVASPPTTPTPPTATLVTAVVMTPPPPPPPTTA